MIICISIIDNNGGCKTSAKQQNKAILPTPPAC